ncbi:MAG: hypothetical protein RBT73_00555 [Spirochaetia bacterium]|jgi:hypothetical protein|nr:hypothetical protein [Spirochaetia bacterium]
MDSDQTGIGSPGQIKGRERSESLISGLAAASFFGISLCALALAAAAIIEAPQGIKQILSICLSAFCVSLFFFVSASFFYYIASVLFKLEKFKALRLIGGLIVWILGLVPLGLVWAVLRIMRGFQA